MSEKEVYMLQRGREESDRLNNQSAFLRVLFNGSSLHPSIPPKNLRAIADVGTGTGIWMNEVQQEFDLTLNGQSVQFVGFDISNDQFPRQKQPGQDYVVHDAVHPFPGQYQDKFDLVHVRFLSYGIKAHQLESFIDSVCQIIRPGGYLQWQEIDGIDVWRPTPTLMSQQLVSWIVSERIARGLTPAITGSLIRTLQTRWTPPTGPNLISPMCWANDLLRIYHLETQSTHQHPSPEVNAITNQWQITVLTQLLQSGAARRSALAENPGTTASEIERLEKEISQINTFVQTLESGRTGESALSGLEVTVTRIVARKARLFGKDDGSWMAEWQQVSGNRRRKTSRL